MSYNELSVAEMVRKAEDLDQDGNTTISKYVVYNQRENIEKIDAYVNSKHTSGEKDSMERDKPFFNIVTAAINIWYRATDIDRKNITIKATKAGHTILSFLATILLNDYMKKMGIGIFLNTWGRTLATYCSAVSKFVEKDGDLIAEVVPWNRIICDPVDFENNIVIERLWFTEAQLRAKTEYDKGMVDALCDAKKSRETMDNQNKDNKAEYIEIFEVHGELPLSLLTEREEDEYDYVQQMHVITYLARKEGNTKNTYDDYTLYSGKEKESPYLIDHLIKEDGRTMGIGAVENQFEAQWMVNHSQKAIKDQLDLASKLIFQTSDGNFVGQNALSSIENGQIMIHQANAPLTQVQNNSHDITSLQSFSNQWKAIGMEINGINEAMTTAPKSGTAWRQTEAALQEAHSLFELMTENKGLAIERMMRTKIIPHLKTKMDTSDEIAAILDEHGIKKIDSAFLPIEVTKRTNEAIKNDILNKKPQDLMSGNIFTPEMQEEMVTGETDAIQKTLNQMGNQRFIKPSDINTKTWKEALKDLEWEVEVDVTGEGKDTKGIMTTLTTMLQTLASLGGQPMPPKMALVFNRLLELSGGMSPVEINAVEDTPPVGVPQQVPQQIPQQPVA